MLYVLVFLGGALAGVAGGFFLARQQMKDYFKKNPPINEEMLRTMMAQMGQKPNEAKIRQMMRSMQKAQK
ncbi:hypothetical protein SAMN02745116_01511 [Pilibacter termitis]|uniref:Uncharacterized protein n=1 Tax=Pilibacter termitis TaxID=263852 RepID=A0A1T4NQL5_9ENTE|nr:YneF family protein [Pilibacter termitis]SJZ81483.1 hypothetical protein SAMN02745116_01511 [Pilibacter termitis]